MYAGSFCHKSVACCGVSIIMVNNVDLTARANDRDLHGLTVWFADNCPSLLPEFQQLLQYWSRLTPEGGMPSRKHMRPQDLVSHLPNIVLLDIIRDEDGAISDIKTRLEGTEVAFFYGDITGHSVTRLPSGEARDRVFFYADILDEFNKPIVSRLSEIRSDRPLVSAHGVYIPLAEDGITMDKIFLALFMK